MGIRRFSVFVVIAMLVGVSTGVAQTMPGDEEFGCAATSANCELPAQKVDVHVRVEPSMSMRVKALGQTSESSEKPAETPVAYYAKPVKCDGEKISLIYRYFAGETPRTQFVKACKSIFADSVDTCQMDRSEIALRCHDKAIGFYQIKKQTKFGDETTISAQPKTVAR